VGKTLLARAMAASIDCSFRRIQFTPDLLPSDILGSSVYHAATGEFVYKQGPLFANVILADEINRTTPRTQSALLEAMSDRQVSVDGKTYPLDPPFIVLATQKPVRVRGDLRPPRESTRPVHDPAPHGLSHPLRGTQGAGDHRTGEPVDDLSPVLTAGDVLQLQHAVRNVRVDDAIADYLLDIVHATRKGEDLHVGVSTRGALTLYRAAQSQALVSGRDFVVPDDVKSLAVPVLAHRVVGKSFLQAGEFGAAEGDHPRPGGPAQGAGVRSSLPMDFLNRLSRLIRRLLAGLWPTQTSRWTRESWVYIFIWFVLLATGMYHQINLILLVAGLAAGPIVGSLFSSAAMLRKLRVTRRVPPYVFAGESLHLDYMLENDRKWNAALALFLEDDLVPLDRTIAGSTSLTPRVFFARVPDESGGRSAGRGRVRNGASTCSGRSS